jgi:hypothetical protein
MSSESHDEGAFPGVSDAAQSVPTLLRLIFTRVLGGIGLAAYAGWSITKLLGNLGSFYRYEQSAFRTLNEAIDRTPSPEAVGPAVAALGGVVAAIVLCILAALAVTYLLPVWHKVIVRHERWLKTQRWATTALGKVILVFAWIAYIVETVAFYVVWVASAIIVFINIMIIVTGLG